MAFRKKTEDFKENYDGFLESLHGNCLNRLLYPNYSPLFEILYVLNVVVVSTPFSCRISFSALVWAGAVVTVEVVPDSATVICGVVVAVVGRDVWITVVGAGVWTGAGAEGDAHPATKIAASRSTPIQIGVLLSIIKSKPFCFNLITVINPSCRRQNHKKLIKKSRFFS